jgi:hypothetical protein
MATFAVTGNRLATLIICVSLFRWNFARGGLVVQQLAERLRALQRRGTARVERVVVYERQTHGIQQRIKMAGHELQQNVTCMSVGSVHLHQQAPPHFPLV